jgi:pyruvate dehydrogenase E1 component alpha subunit
MGSTAIVGGTIPVGVGLAYGIQQAGTDNISCIFFGDAALETGVFYESANFAVVKKLSALFVCENNLYSVYSPLSVRQPQGRKIFEVAKALGLPAEAIDGNDVKAVYEASAQNIAEIREGSGPRFLELSTYRWREHCGPNFDNDIGYRSEAEYRQWKEKEPIARFEKKLLTEKTIGSADIAKIDAEIAREVSAAFEFAKSSPFPAAETAHEKLYAA